MHTPQRLTNRTQRARGGRSRAKRHLKKLGGTPCLSRSGPGRPVCECQRSRRPSTKGLIRDAARAVAMLSSRTWTVGAVPAVLAHRGIAASVGAILHATAVGTVLTAGASAVGGTIPAVLCGITSRIAAIRHALADLAVHSRRAPAVGTTTAAVLSTRTRSIAAHSDALAVLA
jgi:hypothetical protein